MGSLNHFFGSLKSEKKRGKQLIESNRYKRWQTTKYYILIADFAGGVSGNGSGGLAGSVFFPHPLARPLDSSGI